MDQVAAFRGGQPIALTHGVPLMTELGDPRGPMREQMLRDAARWTRLPAMERAKAALVLVAQKGGKLLGFGGRAPVPKGGRVPIPKGAAGLTADPLSSGVVGAMIGGAIGALRSLWGGRQPQRFEVSADGYDVGVIAQHDDGRWQLTLEVEADAVALLPSDDDGQPVALDAVGRAWMLPDTGQLDSGLHRFRINGAQGEAELALELRTAAESGDDAQADD